MFGPHLMLDLYGCKSEKLLDKNFALNFLDELPKILGMKKVSGPHMLEYPANPETWDKGGISAIVIIAESHISIHTFPHPNGYMNIDIFSCKEFDVDLAVQKISEAFGAEKFEKNLLWRGREFPKEEIRAQNCASNQRKNMNKARPKAFNIKPQNKFHGSDGRNL